MSTVPGVFFIRTFDFWHFVGYNDLRKTKGGTGVKQKRYVEMIRQEWRLAMEGLNWFRNKLIAAGRYTDAVDEVLLKVAKAKPQKREIWCWRA